MRQRLVVDRGVIVHRDTIRLSGQNMSVQGYRFRVGDMIRLSNRFLDSTVVPIFPDEGSGDRLKGEPRDISVKALAIIIHVGRPTPVSNEHAMLIMVCGVPCVIGWTWTGLWDGT